MNDFPRQEDYRLTGAPLVALAVAIVAWGSLVTMGAVMVLG